MKRVIKYGIGLIVLVVVVGVVGTFLYMDSIAKSAIEQGGTYALGVDVALGKADVRPFAGRFDIQSFRVANPAGFDQKNFLDLDDGGVAVTLSSLRSDTVEMGELKLRGMDMHLIRDGKTSNYGVILENLKRFESGDASREQQPSESAKKFVIREVDLENITVHFSLPQLGQNIPVEIKLIQLKDVGSGGKPLDMGELIALLLKAVLKAAAERGGDVLPAEMLGDLQGYMDKLKDLNVQELVDGAALDLQGKADSKLGEAKEQLEKAAGDLDNKLNEESKKLGEGLKNLLPTKDEDDE